MVDQEVESTPWISNKFYDVLKFIALILLPALGTLYFSLAGIWNLPHPQEIVGTITVVDTFLGVLLRLSKKAYDSSGAKYDGELNVHEDEDGQKTAVLDLKNYENPADVVAQKEVTFKVNKH